MAIRPYYQLIRLPDGKTEEFELVIPFVPADRQNMVAWMAASSDQPDYGQLTVFRFPEGRTIEGPTQVFARINAARSVTLLVGQGARQARAARPVAAPARAANASSTAGVVQRQ